MEKLLMCRICLVEDVRMYVVVNKNLHELYEKLTDVPFVTEDSRPMLTCLFCCTKLKQCWRFLTKCLEAEKIFTQMLNEDFEPDPLINRGHLEFFNGFSNSAIELFSIIDDGRTASDAVNEELPDVSESPDDIFDQEEEHQTGITEIKLENVDTSYPDLPVYHAESDSEYEVPLMEIKTEVEDDQESIGAPVAKKPNFGTRRPKPRDTISAEQMKNDNYQQLSCVSKIVTKTQNNASKRTTTFKGPFTKTQQGVNNSMNNTALGTSSHNYINKEKNIDSNDIKGYRKVCVKEKLFKCDICLRSFSKNCDLTRHTRTHTGEKPFKCDICQHRFSQNSSLVCHTRVHTGEKPFQCDICQRSFTIKGDLVRHAFNHTGDKPFKCDICPSSFAKKGTLIGHTRTHTGEKPFKCDVCLRSFSLKGNLVSHTRTHSDETPFKCDICQRSFHQKNHLVSHTRTHHTSEKSFKM